MSKVMKGIIGVLVTAIMLVGLIRILWPTISYAGLWLLLSSVLSGALSESDWSLEISIKRLSPMQLATIVLSLFLLIYEFISILPRRPYMMKVMAIEVIYWAFRIYMFVVNPLIGIVLIILGMFYILVIRKIVNEKARFAFIKANHILSVLVLLAGIGIEILSTIY